MKQKLCYDKIHRFFSYSIKKNVSGDRVTNFSAMSWREPINFDEMMSALY